MDVIITDITRMGGELICIAGIGRKPDGSLVPVRPVPTFGYLTREFLVRPQYGRIKPFSVLQFDFLKSIQKAPHVEDRVLDPGNPRNAASMTMLTEKEQRELLEKTRGASLEEIFGQNLVDNRFIYEGESGRSLGCMKVTAYRGPYVMFEKLKIKIRINNDYREYPITDLRLHKFIFEKAGEKSPKDRAEKLRKHFRKSKEIYVRFGLARPFRHDKDEDPDPRKKCYVQVNGIYSFPAAIG